MDRYDRLFRGSWDRVFRGHTEPLAYQARGASGVSGGVSGAVFGQDSRQMETTGGTINIIGVSILIKRDDLNGLCEPQKGDVVGYSGCDYKVTGVAADPAAFTLTCETQVKIETTPGRGRQFR